MFNSNIKTTYTKFRQILVSVRQLRCSFGRILIRRSITDLNTAFQSIDFNSFKSPKYKGSNYDVNTGGEKVRLDNMKPYHVQEKRRS
jgi:hypothetical protein